MKQKELAIFIVILCLVSLYTSKRFSRAEIGLNRFRADSKSMIKVGTKFYEKLREKERNGVTQSGPIRLENSSWIGVGYNVVFGNPLISPAGGKLIDAGFTTNIFEQKYTKGNKTPDDFYLFPDGFSVQPAKACKTNFSSQNIKEAKSLKETMKASIGVDAKYGVGSFSGNAEYNSMTEKMATKDRMYISNTATCSIYRAVVDRYQPPEFSQNFINGLFTLKGLQYSKETEEVFGEFIATFGTHYMYDVSMGSRYTLVEETTKTAYNELKSKGMNVRAQAKYSAFSSVSVKTSVEKHKNTSNSFEKAVTNKFITSVGAPMPPTMDMTEWLKGSFKQPMPVSYNIQPMVELFNSAINKERLKALGLEPEEIQKNIKAAMEDYCALLVKQKKIKSCTDSNFKTNFGAKKKIEAQAKAAATIRKASTEFHGDDKGKVFALDRHDISCGKEEAVNYFRYIRGKKQFKYDYKCIKSQSISNNCTTKETRLNDTGKKAQAWYADRHHLTCDSGTVMRRFKMARNKKKIFFQYTCCKAEVKSCSSFKTKNTSNGKGESFYLDRQTVSAGAQKAIKSFRLVSQGKNYRYEGEFCVLK